MKHHFRVGLYTPRRDGGKGITGLKHQKRGLGTTMEKGGRSTLSRPLFACKTAMLEVRAGYSLTITKYEGGGKSNWNRLTRGGPLDTKERKGKEKAVQPTSKAGTLSSPGGRLGSMTDASSLHRRGEWGEKRGEESGRSIGFGDYVYIDGGRTVNKSNRKTPCRKRI